MRCGRLIFSLGGRAFLLSIIAKITHLLIFIMNTAKTTIQLVDTSSGEILRNKTLVDTFMQFQKSYVEKCIDSWYESFKRGVTAGNNLQLTITIEKYDTPEWPSLF